jgi:hypothetical protein
MLENQQISPSRRLHISGTATRDLSPGEDWSTPTTISPGRDITPESLSRQSSTAKARRSTTALLPPAGLQTPIQHQPRRHLPTAEICRTRRGPWTLFMANLLPHGSGRALGRGPPASVRRTEAGPGRPPPHGLTNFFWDWLWPRPNRFPQPPRHSCSRGSSGNASVDPSEGRGQGADGSL